MQKTVCKNIKTTLLFIIVSFLIIGVLYSFYEYIMPAIISFFIAFLLRSLVKLIMNVTKLNSKISGFISITLCYLVLCIFLIVFFKFVFTAVSKHITSFPDYYNKAIIPFVNRIIGLINNSEVISLINKDIINKFIENVYITILNIITSASAKLAVGLPNAVMSLTFTVILSYFICIDYQNITSFIISHIPLKINNYLHKLRIFFKDFFMKILYSYALIFIVTFCVLSAGFFLLKAENFISLAFFISIADALPLIGVGIILIPWGVVEFIGGNTPLAVGLITLFLITEVIRNIIEPKIIGKSTGLHPALTLILLYIGIKSGSIILMLVLPFVVSLIVNMYKHGLINFKVYQNS